MNILVPLGSSSAFFESPEYRYPTPLVEVSGKPIIQKVIENLSEIRSEKKFIFIVREEDCRKFHLDKTLALLAGPNSTVIRLQNETKGAVCSALLAVNHFSKTEPLLISNGDQVFDHGLPNLVDELRRSCDAGCLYFDSVHPRWAYVRTDAEGAILEVAEKNPISRCAIAGLYYFARGELFTQAAQQSIRKDCNVDGQYFIAPVLNELVLKGTKMMAVRVPDEAYYHSFYSPQKIEEYDSWKSQQIALQRDETEAR